MSNQLWHQPPPSSGSRNRTLIIVLSAVAAVLLVAVIAVIAVAVSSGDSSTDSTAASGDRVYGPPAPAEPALDENGNRVCWRGDADDAGKPVWDKDSKKQPQGVLMLTDVYDLPTSHDQLTELEVGVGGMSSLFTGLPFLGLTQLQDKTIGVVSHKPYADGEESTLAVVDPQSGDVVGQFDAGNAESAPTRFDLAARYDWGYHRIETSNDQIQLPAASAGTEESMRYAISVMPDVFDEGTYWVLLRGSSDLYRAELFVSNNWRSMGDSFGDTSQCGTL